MLRLSAPMLVSLFSSILVLNETAQAQLQTDISPQKDNTLYEHVSGSTSNGAGVFLIAGKNSGGEERRTLLQFDIASSLPAGSSIDSVALTLQVAEVPVTPVNIEAHRVLTDWGEGSSNASGTELNGTTASADDATWLHALYDTTFWSTPGGDFEVVTSVSHTVDTTGPHTWPSTAQMITDVQDWLDNPTTNFGWTLTEVGVDSQTVVRFRSRESAAQNKPVLTVFYSIPASIEDENIQLAFSANLAQNYPNPFNSTTIIAYSVPRRSHVEIKIFNVLGQQVQTIVNDTKPAGDYRVAWSGTDDRGRSVSSGVYFYRIHAGDLAATRTMLHLK